MDNPKTIVIWKEIATFNYFCPDKFSVQEANAMQEKVSAQYKNEIEMAKSQRDYELKKAAYDVEVNTKKAESEMAYQLQVQSSIFFFLKFK